MFHFTFADKTILRNEPAKLKLKAGQGVKVMCTLLYKLIFPSTNSGPVKKHYILYSKLQWFYQ